MMLDFVWEPFKCDPCGVVVSAMLIVFFLPGVGTWLAGNILN